MAKHDRRALGTGRDAARVPAAQVVVVQQRRLDRAVGVKPSFMTGASTAMAGITMRTGTDGASGCATGDPFTSGTAVGIVTGIACASGGPLGPAIAPECHETTGQQQQHPQQGGQH